MIGILGIPRPNGVRKIIVLPWDFKGFWGANSCDSEPHENLIKTKRNARFTA